MEAITGSMTGAMRFVDSDHSRLMSRAMDTYTLRQRITASNIANADTPGYNRNEVRFEDELQQVRIRDSGRALHEVTPSIELTDQPVVLEDELLEMSDTQIRVNLVTRSLRHHFDMLRTGITGVNR